VKRWDCRASWPIPYGSADSWTYPPTHARGGYPTWIIRSSRMMTPGRYLLVKLPLFFNISIITLHMSYLSLLAFSCACHCPTRSGNPEIGSACYLDYPVKLDDDLRTPAGGDSPLTFPLRLLHGETCELLERMLQSAHNPITQPRYIRGASLFQQSKYRDCRKRGAGYLLPGVWGCPPDLEVPQDWGI